ncbi:MAG: glycosyltransferase [Thermodesulfovibrionales bacterium]|nr:glycosyltransferase [Thermodesulfovibrionales bacterium]
MLIVHTESATLGGEAYRLIEETRYVNENTFHRALIIGPAKSDFEEVALRSGVPFIGFNFRDFDYHPVNFIGALRLLKTLRPAVVHTHHSADAWIFGVAARLLGIPVVRGRHISLPFKKSFFKNFVYTHLADAYTVSCSSIKREMVDAGLAREEEVFVTPAGVNLEKFNISRIDRSFLRQEIGLKKEDFLIGTACFLRSWKGVDTLMEAFDILVNKNYKNFHLIIAGKGTERMKNTEIYKKHSERIHILGHRDDIEGVIGGLDIFVLASKKSEGVPQVIPQAMALKVPCIGTEIGGIPDVVKDGVTGWLIKPDSPSELADKIRYVYNLPHNELNRIIEKAYNMVHEEYTVESTVKKYFMAYDLALRKRA